MKRFPKFCLFIFELEELDFFFQIYLQTDAYTDTQQTNNIVKTIKTNPQIHNIFKIVIKKKLKLYTEKKKKKKPFFLSLLKAVKI